MGDRANVYVHDGGNPGVYLYTHNRGSDLPEIVRAALSRRKRWGDDGYLARIIFAEMTKGREGNENGFGITAYEIGAEYVIDVDTATGRVRVGDGQWQLFERFIATAAS